MTESQFLSMRARLSTLVALGVWGLLAWRHFHGGVPVHHVLRRADLPGLSCWWDGLLAPALTWILASRVRRRLVGVEEGASAARALRAVVLGWAGALAFGLTLGWAALNNAQVAGSAPSVLLLLALFFPIYRAECVLGFVLGMIPAVGSILPLVFAGIMAFGGALLHLGLRPILLRAGRWVLGA